MKSRCSHAFGGLQRAFTSVIAAVSGTEHGAQLGRARQPESAPDGKASDLVRESGRSMEYSADHPAGGKIGPDWISLFETDM